MPHDVATTIDAICELHKEWSELVALRRRVRAAPHNDAAERDLVNRLRRHQTRLGALRDVILSNETRHPRTPASSPRRSGHVAH